MSEADAAYQQGYTRGFQRGLENLQQQLLIAVEFGYKQAEKGKNLQQALFEAQQTLGRIQKVKRKQRSNLEKQERVVEILWEFAQALQNTPEEEKNCTRTADGTKLKLDHVGQALEGIMQNFGYRTLEVQ